MNLKIALIQESRIRLDLKKSLDRGIKCCEKAKMLGADIVLFPEMWSIGYTPPFENAFDYPEEDGHTEEIEIWNSMAIDTNSEWINAFCACARKLNIAVLVTFLQKNNNSKPSNSALLIDRNGSKALKYNKVHTCDFSFEAFCQAGDSYSVAELDTQNGKIKIGVMICFDREFPESARALTAKGAELILIPNCCPIDENRKSQLRSRAFENMTAVAMANYADENMGHSMVFDAIAYDNDGNYRDMLITELDCLPQISVCEIDIDKLRKYRDEEVWGLKYLKAVDCEYFNPNAR